MIVGVFFNSVCHGWVRVSCFLSSFSHLKVKPCWYYPTPLGWSSMVSHALATAPVDHLTHLKVMRYSLSVCWSILAFYLDHPALTTCLLTLPWLPPCGHNQHANASSVKPSLILQVSSTFTIGKTTLSENSNTGQK